MTPRPPLDELLELYLGDIAAEGVTTAPGNGAGTSFIDAALAGAGAGSYFPMLAVLYVGDSRRIDSRETIAFNNATGEVTLASAYKGVAAAIPAGVKYQIRTGKPSSAAVAAIAADIDGLTTRTGRVVLFKDKWCDPSTIVPSLAFSNVGANRDFPNVVLPAAGTFLPAGAVIQEVNLLVKWRKMVDSSGALNAINAANKTIRIKTAADGWAASLIAITMANGMWSTAASAPEGGDVLVGSVDIKAKVAALGTTYNVRSDQTTTADAITVTAASLTLYDVATGLRVYYTLA
jgi:hypothetical protein